MRARCEQSGARVARGVGEALDGVSTYNLHNRTTMEINYAHVITGWYQ
jgi:hypothetical protein